MGPIRPSEWSERNNQEELSLSARRKGDEEGGGEGGWVGEEGRRREGKVRECEI